MALSDGQIGSTEQNLYVIAHDAYFGIKPNINAFVGSYRDLLYHLNGVDTADLENPIDEDDPHGRRLADISDGELEHLFIGANGDGQPYYLIFDVNAGERILAE